MYFRGLNDSVLDIAHANFMIAPVLITPVFNEGYVKCGSGRALDDHDKS